MRLTFLTICALASSVLAHFQDINPPHKDNRDLNGKRFASSVLPRDGNDQHSHDKHGYIIVKDEKGHILGYVSKWWNQYGEYVITGWNKNWDDNWHKEWNHWNSWNKCHWKNEWDNDWKHDWDNNWNNHNDWNTCHRPNHWNNEWDNSHNWNDNDWNNQHWNPENAVKVQINSKAGKNPIDIYVPPGQGNINYQYIGGVKGYYSDSPDINKDSSNYCYVAGTNQTPPKSPPCDFGNSFTSCTGYQEHSESAIWEYDNQTGQLIPYWVNKDSSKPYTYLRLFCCSKVIFLTGDVDKFSKQYGPSQAITFWFVEKDDNNNNNNNNNHY